MKLFPVMLVLVMPLLTASCVLMISAASEPFEPVVMVTSFTPNVVLRRGQACPPT